MRCVYQQRAASPAILVHERSDDPRRRGALDVHGRPTPAFEWSCRARGVVRVVKHAERTESTGLGKLRPTREGILHHVSCFEVAPVSSPRFCPSAR